MNRGTIQLSMNFLVTIIIALAMLALGILLLRQFVGVTVETQKELSERTQDRISELLDQGQQIVIPFSRQTVKRGDSYLFGVGVLNIDDDASFVLDAAFSRAFRPDETELSANELTELNPSSWLRADSQPFTLKKNERQSKTVFVQIPTNAPSGTYIFNVMAYKNPPPKDATTLYDAIKKIIIVVP